jgi:hypothetical protein
VTNRKDKGFDNLIDPSWASCIFRTMSFTAKQESTIEITGARDLEARDRATLKFLHRHADNSGEALDPHTRNLTELRNSLDRLMAVKITLKGVP